MNYYAVVFLLPPPPPRFTTPWTLLWRDKCLQFPGKWCRHTVRRDSKSLCDGKLSTTKTPQTVTLQVTILCQQISKKKQHAPEHSFALTLRRSFVTIFWQKNLTKLQLAKRWKTNGEKMVDFGCRFFHGLVPIFFTVYADFSRFARDINGEKKNISL